MKTLFISLILAAGLLQACNRAGNEAGSRSGHKVSINPENVVLVDMDVRGMSCTDCENTIKSGITELNGVMAVTADYKAGRAEVKCDTSIATVADLTKVVEKRGYSVAGTKIMPAGDIKP